MSGTRKSTVIGAVAARGYRASDAKKDGLSVVVSVPGEVTGLDPG